MKYRAVRVSDALYHQIRQLTERGQEPARSYLSKIDVMANVGMWTGLFIFRVRQQRISMWTFCREFHG